METGEINDFDSLFRLDGKIALVTGGSRGIGFQAAAALLLAGCAKVIITARNPQTTSEAATKLNALKAIRGTAVSIPANVGHTDSIEELVAAVKREANDKVDILIANAGASWGGSFETFDDWKSVKTLDVNVRGVFNLVRFMAPLLSAAGTSKDPARVIVVSSIAGTAVPHVGDRGSIMYSASKAAALHLARNLALELVPRHITTNVISPGFFPTRLALPQINHLGGKNKAGQSNPMGRLGEPQDIAGAVVYLCSRAGTYANGVNIILDGGGRLRAGTQLEHGVKL